MIKNYKNKKCLIFGASDGLGSKVAIQLASEEADLYLIGKNKIKLETIKNKCIDRGASSVNIMSIDLKQGSSIDFDKGFFKDINLSALDLFFYSAATNYNGKIIDIPIKKIKELFEINFFSAVLFVRKLLNELNENSKCHMVFISSGSGQIGTFGQGIYSSSKAALDRFCESLMFELEKTEIKITIVYPGKMNTKLANSPEIFGKILNTNKYIGKDPKNVAKQIVKKMKTQNKYIYLNYLPLYLKSFHNLIPNISMIFLSKIFKNK